MMQCFIYSHEELIGKANFVAFDPGMGVASAPFSPSENYEKIRPTVHAFSLLGSLADINATDETKAHAEEVSRRFASLGLTARTDAGEVLEPEGGVSLWDFSKELDDDPYEVSLLGLPRDISENYFHEAIRQYRGGTREG